jgi:hypothetical protein
MSERDIVRDAEAPPVRGKLHESMSVFLGRWESTGESYGAPDQDATDPRSRPEAWTATHTCAWHTGEFFLIDDERAVVGGKTFDTHGVMGVDAATGRLFVQSFENHGFERRYDVTFEGRVWTYSGEHERARIEFSQDGRMQTIAWEWKPKDMWLPLCDRVARRAILEEVRA